MLKEDYYTEKDVVKILGIPKSTIKLNRIKGRICKDYKLQKAKDKNKPLKYREEDIYRIYMQIIFKKFKVEPETFNEIYEDIISNKGDKHRSEVNLELLIRLRKILFDRMDFDLSNMKVVEEMIKSPEKFLYANFNPYGLEEYTLREDRLIINTIRKLPVESRERLDNAIHGYVTGCSDLFKADITEEERAKKQKEKFSIVKNVIEENLGLLSVHLSTQLTDSVFSNEYLGTEMTPELLGFIKLPFISDAEEETFRLCEDLLGRFSTVSNKSKKRTAFGEISGKKMNYETLVKEIDNRIIKSKGAERRVEYLRNLESLLLRWDIKDLTSILDKTKCIKIAEVVGNYWTKIAIPYEDTTFKEKRIGHTSFRKPLSVTRSESQIEGT